MSAKVTKEEFVQLVEYLGLEFSPFWGFRGLVDDDVLSVTKADVAAAHNCAKGTHANINALRKDFELLLDHLGLVLKNNPKSKTLVKKAKK